MEVAQSSSGVDGDCLVFEVNGERFEIPEIDPSTTLLEFLRTRTRFKSVKLSCGEGGCGSCVVMLTKYDAASDRVESFSISSCLTLVCSINGCSVTTSEGLGNTKDGFHPIHQRFAGFHASQCGFCTPGMCMSLFSALANAEKTNTSPAKPGFSRLSAAEAEKAISGNLCRCTGYRPIADACKSFAADVDLEDLGMNSFWRNGDRQEVKVSKLPFYDPKDHISPYVQVSKDVCKPTKFLNSGKHLWYSPTTLEELHNLLDSHMHENGDRVKLVVGNTGDGYYNEMKKYHVYIDLRYIPQLSLVQKNHSGIEFGAALSISKVISYLKENDIETGVGQVFSKIASHMEKVASSFIRNSGSLGGNIVMSQRKRFPSDVATLLLAVSSSVSIFTSNMIKIMTMEEFLSEPPLNHKALLLSISIPFTEPVSDSRVFFETYRAAPRPLGNALPYLNASFFGDVSHGSSGILLNRVQLAFGAYGTSHAVRARGVEEYLTGKLLTVKVVDEAIKIVKGDVVPEEGTSHAAYRSSLAVSFLFYFLSTIFADGSAPSCGLAEKLNGSLLAVKMSNGDIITQIGNSQLLSSAKQVVESTGKDYFPVGVPMPKTGSAIQASGEAVFVDDIPSPPNCLHGALVYSTKPLARVKGISFETNALPTDLITVKDIPRKGENIGCLAFFGPEPLFADGVSRFAGDIIALVVADTQRNAYVAAKTAVVDYDTEGLDPPILSVEEAVKRSSFIDVPPVIYPKQVGDFSKGMAEADHKILSAEMKLGSQYYYYMETQTALAVPEEDNCILVYSSIQCPEFLHRVISKCLGVPEHNVRVLTRRVGGGFGGKGLKAMIVATLCALAAHKLQRPVKIYLDRKTDMIIGGGRHPMKVTYNVGFKADGKITALHLDILIDAGITEDISPKIPDYMVGALKKYDWGALSFDIKVCKTNRCSKSAMRAPGEVQGSFIAEAIIEHVASVLSVEVDSIRSKNLHSYTSLTTFYGSAADEPLQYTLPSIWDKVARSSQFNNRKMMIEQFNSSNIWCKRGISRVPVVYELTMRSTPGKVSILWDGSIVVEVGGIELGQGLWTKVKQVTAYALRLIQCDGTEDLVEKIRVVQSDTLSLVQGGFTAGSTTSESSCEAARLCCNILVERLRPLKEKLQEQMGTVSWDVLILQANYQSVHLSANSFFVPEPSAADYLNYGAAVSEVEVNILTGETTILRTDIVYDCGQSMNPAVDMGQIEGAFVQGLGFFMLEEHDTNDDGLVITNGTWTYKIPTIDTIPKQFNVEVLNSGHNRRRVLSSKGTSFYCLKDTRPICPPSGLSNTPACVCKDELSKLVIAASGEPPLLLAASVHCATRAAIKEARKQLVSWGAVEGTESTFQLDVPATMAVVKKLCGLNVVETYLQTLLSK